MFPLAVVALNLGYSALDKGLIPDLVIRQVIRGLLRQRLREIDAGSFEANHAVKMKWIEKVRQREAIAEMTEKANNQHYEVSTDFMLSCLGRYAKYSSCFYPTATETLDQAELAMMELYCKNAQLKDGQAVLDLGCGWGSLSLYVAQKYPHSRITALSNSTTQKEYIDKKAAAQGIHNVEVITADINTFNFQGSKHFDRILSIEMFEHMKNYKLLLEKVATWLRPDCAADDALVFIQVFCHRSMPYDFKEGDGWMANMFFSGGTMPSHDLLLYFQDDLSVVRSWYLNGRHYAQTCEDWLKNQDKSKHTGLASLQNDARQKGVGEEEGTKTFYRFRVFYMACAELFAMNDGQEWGVGHYLFKRKN